MAVLYTFDAVLVSDLVSLQNAYKTALTAAGNVLSAIPASTAAAVSQQALTIAGVVYPLTKSTDPELASNAADLYNLLLIISNLLSGQGEVSISLQMWAPNLYALAAAYYNDATLWQDIADASGMNDPIPSTGLFTVIIPVSGVKKPAPGVAFPS